MYVDSTRASGCHRVVCAIGDRARGQGARCGGYLASTIVALALLLGSWLPPPAHAHAPEQSYIFLRMLEGGIEGYFEVTVADLNKALELGFPGDGSATAVDVESRLEPIVAYLLDKVSFAPNGTPSQIEITGHDLLTVSFAQFAVIKFRLSPVPESLQYVDVEYGVLLDEVPNHRGLLVIAENWKSGTFDNESQVSLVFGPSDRTHRLDLSSSTVWSGFRAFVGLGAHHIWIGIDHILFLVALLLPSVVRRGADGWEAVERPRTALYDLVKIVTLFTVAHSITLVLAALGYIDVPSRVVESIIAFSIAVAAVNIIYPIFRGRIGWIVFGFGLFHGLGFASVLGEMGVPGQYVPITLLGFNVGVELGQLAIVCLVFPALYLLRGTWLYRRAALTAGPAALIAIAMYWFTERAFEVDLPAGAILNSVVAAVL